MSDFTQKQRVIELVEQIHKEGLDEKRYSDILDDEGHQYVDLVQEGGGVLGIALVGYTYIMEQAGIRFFNLAGTSAGAINTLMMACVGKVGQPVSGPIVNTLSSLNMYDFVDGPTRIKKLIQRFLEKRRFFKLFLFLNVFLIWRTLKRALGFNPGVHFEVWLSGKFSTYGIKTWNNLKAKRRELPKLYYHQPKKSPQRINDEEALVKVITSEVSTHSKVVLPEMAELYWKDPGNVDPAKFVRASMSIPLFFWPFKVSDIPQGGTMDPKTKMKWNHHVSYDGKIPEEVRFVDGGMLSNFPINAFHVTTGTKPRKPTFGVKLSTWRDEYTKVNKVSNFAGAMLSTMRQLHDYDFLRKNPDYGQLICYIDADKKFNWLDFKMSKGDQEELFILGAQKAIDFLRGFDWNAYKTSR